MSESNRDSFLLCRRGLLGAAATAGGLAFLPSIFMPRTARADLRPGAPATRVLILNMSGGIRSSAAFHASTRKKYNPYGLITEVSGTELQLGRYLDDYCPAIGETAPAPASTYALPGAWNGLALPRLRDLASAFSVIATWSPERGDHIVARTKEPTGSSAGDEPGILTRIGAGLYDALKKEADFPTFHLVPAANFGKTGAFGRFAPVTLNGPGSLPGGEDYALNRGEIEQLTGHDWAKDDADRGTLDEAVIARRAKSGRELAQQLALHRRAARDIGATLAQPFVNVASIDAQNAVLGKVDVNGQQTDLTNRMLRDLFLTTLAGAGTPTEHMAYPFAMDAAIAVRLLQLKSRAVCLEMGSWDYHSGEIDGRPLFAFLGRLWAALAWLLKRIPDPEVQGKSLFDTTLVLTMSDFGRDAGSEQTGYNGGGGSDHGADPSCYTLAHAVMGAGVKGGKLRSKVSTQTYRGDQADVTYSPRQLLAMTLWSLGLDHRNGAWGFEDVSDPIQAAWT